MRKAVIIFLVYSSGYITSYLLGKSILINWAKQRKEPIEWTISDRNFQLRMSCFSWLCVCSQICVLIGDLPNNQQRIRNSPEKMIRHFQHKETGKLVWEIDGKYYTPDLSDKQGKVFNIGNELDKPRYNELSKEEFEEIHNNLRHGL